MLLRLAKTLVICGFGIRLWLLLIVITGPSVSTALPGDARSDEEPPRARICSIVRFSSLRRTRRSSWCCSSFCFRRRRLMFRASSRSCLAWPRSRRRISCAVSCCAAFACKMPMSFLSKKFSWRKLLISSPRDSPRSRSGRTLSPSMLSRVACTIWYLAWNSAQSRSSSIFCDISSVCCAISASIVCDCARISVLSESFSSVSCATCCRSELMSSELTRSWLVSFRISVGIVRSSSSDGGSTDSGDAACSIDTRSRLSSAASSWPPSSLLLLLMLFLLSSAVLSPSCLLLLLLPPLPFLPFCCCGCCCCCCWSWVCACA
eukprot:comp21384_c0_seq3/m.46143 comp21384_c0_seq3/g.46143  ORF comp21384_c0_seq3/g.46143 comp21384_c0_seq3/m.46143 type:complete len:319 (-) comp21384_c0_seq3:720-1676(-)